MSFLEKFNNILVEYNQKLRAVSITGKEVKLSNGVCLTSEKDVRLCKRRVSKGHTVWKENFDKLYHKDVNVRKEYEKRCRSKTSAQGGVNCQKKHGVTIAKHNLTCRTAGFKKGNKSWNAGLTKHTNKSIAKLSENRKGAGNPMYGKSHTEEYKKQQSIRVKQSILNGKFTPNSNNRNTHWDSYYNGKKYRSSWEALYQHFDPGAEYETLRIPYIFENKEFIYIVDFVNHKTKQAIEVKPKELIKDKKTQCKLQALKEWCKSNNYNFILADKNYFISQTIPKCFDNFDKKTQEKIQALYEVNKTNKN